MNTDTPPLYLDTPMPSPRLRESEWIWLARILLFMVFLATGGMRLTMDVAQLATLGDWTRNLLPVRWVGAAQILAAATLLLPKTRLGGAATLAGSFLLLSYLLGSLLTHLTTGGNGWSIDVLRIAGLAVVLRDLWRGIFLGRAGLV